MTEMQKRMQELISKEALAGAFDARFPKEMQEKLRQQKLQSRDLAVWDRTLRSCLREAGSGNCFWSILTWLM